MIENMNNNAILEIIKMERKGIEKLSYRNKIQGSVYFKKGKIAKLVPHFIFNFEFGPQVFNSQIWSPIL